MLSIGCSGLRLPPRNTMLFGVDDLQADDFVSTTFHSNMVENRHTLVKMRGCQTYTSLEGSWKVRKRQIQLYPSAIS